MGMFDTVEANGNRYQTKSLGKNLRFYRIGEQVKVLKSPFNTDEYLEYMGGGFDDSNDPRFAENCFVECMSEEEDDNDKYYMVIKDNILVDVVKELDNSFPLFDYYGRQIFTAEDYSYSVERSHEDEEFVATVKEFPSLSFLSETKEGALFGLKEIVTEVLEDIKWNYEIPPTPHK